MKPVVLALLIDPITAAIVREILNSAEIVEAGETDFMKFLEEPLARTALVLCGPPTEAAKITATEVAQGLGLAYPGISAIYVTSTKEGFDRPLLQKNGFKDGYLLPLEKTEFAETAKRILGGANSEIDAYKSVKLLDMEGGDVLDFDLFILLPFNNKYLKYVSRGSKLNPEQLRRLQEREVSAMFVRETEMPRFYKFTAQKLLAMGKSSTLSETEKQERIKQSVRTIMSDVFAPSAAEQNFESGKKVITDCQEVVKSYLSAVDSKQGSFYEKFSALAQSESGFYSGAANVSTFASLFALGLGIGKPEEVAMAGMLCDVGMSALPPAVQSKTASERTPEEEKIYRTHPAESLTLFKAKRMTLSDYVLKLVVQHHEQFDGKGYPAGLPSIKILPEAQLLGISSEFADLIRFKEGQQRLTPREAIDEIIKTHSGTLFDPALLGRIKTLLENG